MLIIIIGLFSTIIGSFLNVLIYRWPIMLERNWQDECAVFLNPAAEKSNTNKSHFNFALPRSHCPHCQKPLKIWHNIPLLSYLFLKGKCAFCQVRISPSYFLVEFLSVILGIAMTMLFGCSEALAGGLLFTYSLIAIAFIDAKHMIIPDTLNYFLLWSGLLISVFSLYPFMTPQSAIMGAALGYSILWLIATLFKILTKKDGLGQGDFKLLAALGAWVGPENLIFVVLFASVIGLIYGFYFIIKTRKKSIKNIPIPFGPFLAIGGMMVFLYCAMTVR
jgi:leader peptidase (prepilin peptidase)/N-methyltransferase